MPGSSFALSDESDASLYGKLTFTTFYCLFGQSQEGKKNVTWLKFGENCDGAPVISLGNRISFLSLKVGKLFYYTSVHQKVGILFQALP